MTKGTQLTCMNTFVDLQVLGPGEELAAAREGAGKWFLSSVDPDMVDQLVFGFEGPQLPRAVLPEAGVVGDLGTTDVLDSDVSDYLVKAAENLVARLSRRGLFRVDPHASHLLVLQRLSHVPEKRPLVGGCGHPHTCKKHEVSIFSYFTKFRVAFGVKLYQSNFFVIN